MPFDRTEPCCPAKPDLKARPLIDVAQAASLERTFKILANGTRVRILHALCLAGEICVSDLAETLGMRPTAVSNQLRRLAVSGIIQSRRDGVRIIYRVVDPCVVKLLDAAWCLAEDATVRTRGKSTP